MPVDASEAAAAWIALGVEVPGPSRRAAVPPVAHGDELDAATRQTDAVRSGTMTASLPLIRKLNALTNRITEALNVVFDDEPQWHFDPLDAVLWFEKWIKIRAELMATEPELDDIPECQVPQPKHEAPDSWGDFDGRGFISREPILRMHKDIRSAWDVLNHPSRQVAQVSIDREGVFVGGKPFDAMMAITSIVRAATESVAIVDGYVSDHTISLLGVKADPVAARILTRSSNPTLVTAARTFNAQYSAGPPLEIRTTAAFHDRFIAIDDADYYHFGHSIKDAAKRQAFMFSRIEEPAVVTAVAALIAKEWAAATVVPL